MTALLGALGQAYWLPNSVKQEMSGYEPDGLIPEYLIPMNYTIMDSAGISDETAQKLREATEEYLRKLEKNA